MQPKTLGEFLTGIFSEPDGNPSFSRLISFLAFLFVMAIYAAQFAKSGQPPAGLDLLEALIGASSPYALNRVGRAFTKPEAK
jgi:hypothetical protein